MTHRRPQNLVALLWRLTCALLSKHWLWLAALLVVAVVVALVVWRPAAPSVATFNIQDYPQSDEQAAGAFELVGALEVDAVGVQEITDARHFERFTDDYLGEDWEVAFADQRRVRHRVGLAFDSTDVELVESRTHRETVVQYGARATLEAHLRSESPFGARTVRVFVVHLKAGGDHSAIRQKQLRRLRPIVDEAVASDDDVVLMGDFNTTGPADVRAVDALAESVGLEWTTRDIGCTAYWEPDDNCESSTLDHILATRSTDEVDAVGACESVGCESRHSCPIYVDNVSDHCPVRAEF
ncbi:MAG: endonuclease/exonuclease/phosphatase family protein [Persicimonas sp.]